MPKIIQFLHTAQEAKPESKEAKIIGWNNGENHTRKFILSEGKYVNNTKDGVQTEEINKLTFWGEWEAQSEITLINKENNVPPTLLNKPFLDLSQTSMVHNTDPYVFGDYFRYIICKQRTFHKVLTNLESNSIILFGSSIDKKFRLDTVFVVSNYKVNFRKHNLEEGLFKNEGDKYYNVGVRPILGNKKCNSEDEDSCVITDNKEYTFYRGVNFNQREQHNKMYSFVPCKVYSHDNPFKYTFRQPILNLDFIEHQQTQGVNSKDCSQTDIVNYWNKIVTQVENQNLLKGVSFVNPPLSNKL